METHPSVADISDLSDFRSQTSLTPTPGGTSANGMAGAPATDISQSGLLSQSSVDSSGDTSQGGLQSQSSIDRG